MVCEVVPGGGWWESGPHLLEMALPHLLFKLIRMLTTGAVFELEDNDITIYRVLLYAVPSSKPF